MNRSRITASVLIIGNEILSGRTQDLNLQYIAQFLIQRGVVVTAAHIIPDDEDVIVDYINQSRIATNYVLTSGGIGPTHDDVTAACVAKAFGVPLVTNPTIAARITDRTVPPDILDRRMRMARVPKGAKLIENLTGGPHGFYIENVYVMAGIPRVLQNMLPTIEFKGGNRVHSCSLEVDLGESTIAAVLENSQKRFKEVEIGSYPFKRNDRYGTTVVFRSTNQALILNALDEVREWMHSQGFHTNQAQCDWLEQPS